jgi:hypothetical protein
MRKQIVTYPDETSFLQGFQSGFRVFYNTTSAALKIDLSFELDRGRVSVLLEGL